jgi:methyl-accepting chemotaxis protein
MMKIKAHMRKISVAVPVKTIISITVVFAVLCGVLALMLSSFANNQVEQQIDLLATENAQIASTYLEAMQAQSKSISLEVQRDQGFDQTTAAPLIQKSLLSVLDDPRIFSAYAAFEPNQYFPETPDGLSYYAYRDGDKINMDINNDYATYNTGDYYAASKASGAAHITEPYSYQLSNGETVWLITISNPIFSASGTFIGVTNCDVLADTLNNLPYDLNNYKTAYSYILTDQGNYVTNTADKTAFGSAFEDEDKDKIMQSVASGDVLSENGTNHIYGGSAYEIYVPMNVHDISQHWSCAFLVSKSEVLAPVTQITMLIAVIAVAGIVILSLIIAYLLRKALRPVDDIVIFTKELGNGNLNAELKVNVDNELGDIASSLKSTAAALSQYIHEIASVLGEISNNNLMVTVDSDFVGDFATIKTSILHIISSLNATMQQISHSSKQVSDGASQVSNSAQTLSQGTTEQAAVIEELAASIQEVSDGVNNNAAQVHEAAKSVDLAVAGVETSNDYMKKMLGSIHAINESSKQISKIMKAIDDIAFQTNILALNAAVEAARAGTAGKGFAVVAEEVRNLAGKSAEAAKQTSALIEGSIKAVTDGSRIAEETAKSLEIVSENSLNVKDNILKIERASVEQALSISQITQGLTQVSVVVQTNSATAEESAAASEELFGQSETLQNEVNKFKLN